MEPEMVTALATGMVTIIAALAAAIVSIRTKAIVEKDAAKKDEKLKELHVLVNGRFTKALEEIADVRELLAGITQASSDKALAEKARNDAVKSAEIAASEKEVKGGGK